MLFIKMVTTSLTACHKLFSDLGYYENNRRVLMFVKVQKRKGEVDINISCYSNYIPVQMRECKTLKWPPILWLYSRVNLLKKLGIYGRLKLVCCLWHNLSCLNDPQIVNTILGLIVMANGLLNDLFTKRIGLNYKFNLLLLH